MSKFIVSFAAAIIVLIGMFAAAAAIFAGGMFVGFTYINSMCTKEPSVMHRFDKPSYYCEPYTEDGIVEDTGIRETVEPLIITETKE